MKLKKLNRITYFKLVKEKEIKKVMTETFINGTYGISGFLNVGMSVGLKNPLLLEKISIDLEKIIKKEIENAIKSQLKLSKITDSKKVNLKMQKAIKVPDNIAKFLNLLPNPSKFVEGYHKMNNNLFTKIFIFIWLFSFLFILITLISLGAFKEDIDVKNIKDKILEYIDEKDTEIYLENQKIESKEKEIINEIFTGENYDVSPFQEQVSSDLKDMKGIEIKLKRKNTEISFEIFNNFDCVDSKDSKGNICDMDDILKISYNGQIKKINLYVADEANEILKKYCTQNLGQSN